MAHLSKVVGLAMVAVNVAGCRSTVDLTGSPRPFVPRDTLMARRTAVAASGVHGVQLVVADGAAFVAAGPSDSVRVSLVARERIILLGQGRDRFRVETGGWEGAPRDRTATENGELT